MLPAPPAAVTDPAELRRYAADVQRWAELLHAQLQAEIDALRARLIAAGL